jgi:predicted TIM-barrel fold metal-dependent hydrolase
LIETCTHHRGERDVEVLEHLDDGWRGYVGKPGTLRGGHGMRQWIPRQLFVNPAGDDAPGTDGGSSAAAAARLLPVLEARGVERALLLFDRAMFVPATPNPHLALAMVRALNDWTVSRWLELDERLYGAVLVPSQTPEAAAAEIARAGNNEKMAAVLLASPALGKTLGHPVYDPIYRAAAELDLPVVLHSGGDAVVDTPTGPAGGPPLTFAEYAAVAPFGLISQLLSLLSNGVLDRYPSLRFLVVGAGVTWIPGFRMRFELIYRALRREIPWVKREIADYFERQIRVATYGLELGAGSPVLRRIVEQNEQLGSWLVYGSGYPSWDAATADDVAAAFPAEWHERLFRTNAEQWLRWPRARSRPAASAQEGVTLA